MFTIIVPTKQNEGLLRTIKEQVSSDDQLIIENIPKYPISNLDGIIRGAKFNKIILINTLSQDLDDGFIDNFKKEYDKDIVYARRHDDPINDGFVKSTIPNMQKDDIICFNKKNFRTLRDLRPTSDFFMVIKELVKMIGGNMVFVPIIRNEYIYSDHIKKLREEKTKNNKIKNELIQQNKDKNNDLLEKDKKLRLDAIKNKNNTLQPNIRQVTPQPNIRTRAGTTQSQHNIRTHAGAIIPLKTSKIIIPDERRKIWNTWMEDE